MEIPKTLMLVALMKRLFDVKLFASTLTALTLLVCSFMLSACGYRYGESSLASDYASISVPFVDGDPDGELTSTIVRHLTGVLSMPYCPRGGQLVLKVKIVDFDDENIGYRYQYKKKHKRTNALEPVESRMSLVAEVSLIDATTDCECVKPVRLVAMVDVDHDYNYCVWRRDVTQFSLGQLTDADAAFAASRAALNQELARKIGVYLNSL
jgi:hypothetical protein